MTSSEGHPAKMSTSPLPDQHSPETIALHVDKCLKIFNTLCEILSRPYAPFHDQIQLSDVRDEFGRFRIWSGNIGAHRTGRSSLDYRLRDASHIRQRVISLLQDLNEILQEGTFKFIRIRDAFLTASIVTSIGLGEKVPWDLVSSNSDDSEADEHNVDAQAVPTIA
jgi:hypothetical protein